MKKILTILAATATMFAFGAGQDPDPQPQVGTVDHGADFEAFTAGDAFSAGLNDKAQQSNPYYWYTADTDAANIISNYVGETNATTPIGMRPDKFKQENNTKFLQVETTGKLYRTVKDNGGSADFTTSVTATYAHSLAEAPIYLDTLVKFTAADSVFGDDALENGDKIAIEYVEHESEGDGDPTVTNFVIRAGYVQANGEIVQTNYFADVPATFKKDDWHRLTVRAIGEVGGSGDNSAGVGFVVYLDEEPLVYSPSVEPGDATYTAKFNSIITENFYKSNLHAIYPSAVLPDTAAGQMISAAAFSGNGSLDDVVFTTTEPNFIDETSLVTITWDTNKITAVTLNNTALTSEEWENGSINIEPDQTGVVSFSVEYAPGCVAGESEVTSGTGSWDGHTAFTGLAPGAVCEIVAMMPFYQVGGKYFEDLESAIAEAQKGTAEAPAMFKLLANCNRVLGFSPEGEGNCYIVLDLNGCNVQGGDDDVCSILNNGITLAITNSGAEASVLLPTNPSEEKFTLLAEAGLTIVQAGTYEGLVIPGDKALTITGGKFFDAAGTFDPADPTTFYLAGSVASDVACKKSGDYVQVGSAASQPTTYEITWTLTGGTTSATAGNFEENDTIVFTADSGKTLSFVSIDGTEIADTSVYGASSYTYTVGTAAATLVVTFTTPATPTYAISWTLTGGTTEATAGDFKENDTIVFTAETGKTLSFVSIDGTEIADTSVYGASSYTYTVGTAAAALVVTFTGSSYPSYINDATKQGKYDTWKDAMTAAGVDVGDGGAYEDAYLLNCKPSEVADAKAAFKFTSISYDTTQSKWVTATTTSYNERGYNGTVVVKQYSDVGCTTESSTGTFFKAFLQ